MPMIGKSLAHYEIIAEIGKGGMGEVYQAKDTKLGRDVAIKVLPEEFARDADRVARFQREAKLLASLNHPNIAAIYGLEESDGTHFLVMELIEGQTLADRIKAGAIPVEEALKLALQIAEALEAAHEKGVIHRDLKPANIKVTPDSKVKVLDFGLAKAFAAEKGDVNLSNSPTLSVAATQQGVILGTAAYMSPEQASGEVTDKKTDIWAFGVVLFEMLTGRSLFEGNNVSQTLASVIKSEPEWTSLPTNVHSRIRFLLERCLEKEAKNRYSSISDARVELQKVLADPSGVFAQPSATGKPRKKRRIGISWVAAALILGLIIAGVAVWMLKPTPPLEPKQVHRYNYDLPEDQQLGNIGEGSVAVSADGSKIVYVANRQLYLKNSNELTAIPIQGTDEDPTNPFFSPDGQSIGYFAGTQLKKIGISGGAPVKLCEATSLPYGATWGADGMIVFGQADGIKRVSSNGGTPEILIKPGEGELFHGPSILPGGEWLLFTVTDAHGGITRWDEAQIVKQSLESGDREVLVSGGSDARYVPSGHLVYALGNNLIAVGFDSNNLEKTGQTVSIIEGVLRATFTGASAGSANYAFSDEGMLAYVSGGAASSSQTLVWVDRNGKEDPLEAPPDAYSHPRISPDGKMVALEIESGTDSDIWKWDLARGVMTKLTLGDADDNWPLWTPDGKQIVFYSTREGSGIYRMVADGTKETKQLVKGDALGMFPVSWSDNGKTLIFEYFTGGWAVDIAVLSMEDDGKWKPLIHGEAFQSHPQISPNEKWIAYTSDESGQNEIYVCSFPDIDQKREKISTSGGQEPRWSPDGQELFYRSENSMMVVKVETDPNFDASAPKTLFRDVYFSFIGHQWDIHPNGEKFLMINASPESTEGIPRERINIIVNWFEELKERLPID